MGSIQRHCGNTFQLASGAIRDCGAEHSPFMLSLLWHKQIRDDVMVAKSAKLDVQTAAELRRLQDPERR
jgi:hypothetical protein